MSSTIEEIPGRAGIGFVLAVVVIVWMVRSRRGGSMSVDGSLWPKIARLTAGGR